MNDTQKLEATGLALQAAIQQREQALNQVIDLHVELTLARSELAQLKAATEKAATEKAEG